MEYFSRTYKIDLIFSRIIEILKKNYKVLTERGFRKGPFQLQTWIFKRIVEDVRPINKRRFEKDFRFFPKGSSGQKNEDFC